MKNHRVRHFRRLFILLILAIFPLRADEPELRELLREALFTEEVTRDPAKAADQYQALIARHDEQRAFAASALFRLAELRRKQARNDEAAAHYQRLLREFPEAAAEAKLAREALAGLGAEIPAAGEGPGGEEAAELQRLEDLAKSAPDTLRDPATLRNAVSKGWPRVVAYLLKRPGESASGELLGEAAAMGHLEICRILLSHKAPSPGEAGTALREAIRNDRRIVLEFLLEEGLDPNSPVQHHASVEAGTIATPLHAAAIYGDAYAAALLLDRGADLERVEGANNAIGKSDNSGGTPLHRAAHHNQLDVLKLLLERGADINAAIRPIASPESGITSLHLAAASLAEASLEVLESLLENGADPNRESVKGPPLRWANTAEKYIALLDAGATDEKLPVGQNHPLIKAIEAKQADLVDRLLEAGVPANDPQILNSALRSGDVEILSRLLDADLDPNLDLRPISGGFQSALELAANLENGKPMLELLIARGAKLTGGNWVREQAFIALPENWKILFHQFAYPEFAEKPAITFHGLIDNDRRNSSRWHEAASRSGDGSPPCLTSLLLEAGSKLLDDQFPRRITLIRAAAEGGFNETVIPLDLEGELPALQWGDIIRAESAPDNLVSREWPPSLRWHLIKRVRFPVTVEIEGMSREILVRGDRLTFDPAKPETPLLGAGRLVELLWQPVNPPASLDGIEVVVRRKGWQDIRMPYRSDATMAFPMVAGDAVSLALPEAPAAAPRTDITLTVPGTPFTRRFPVWDTDESGPLAPLAPTLFQVVTDALTPHVWVLSGPPPPQPAEMPEWQLRQSGNNPPTILSNPDFSRIRVRRPIEGGAEKVIDLDLAAIIAASSDETTAAEAREKDMLLAAGDIVELPIHAAGEEPWAGLSQAEAAFFAKALNATVQVTAPDGTVSMVAAKFAPLRFATSEAGPFPMAGDGIPTFRAEHVLQDAGTIEVISRGGIAYSRVAPDNLGNHFLSDGDQVSLTRRVVGQPVPPPVQPLPTPRVRGRGDDRR